MIKIIDGLTQRQRNQVEQFLHLFSDIEKELKAKLRLRVNDRTSVGKLIERYQERNRLWSDSAEQLRLYADIRNVLTHQRSADFGYPLGVTANSVAEMQKIKDHLHKPKPVADLYRRDVISVSINDSLATVVKLAVHHGFSQFPVVEENRFVGLITETEITRWLGRRASANGHDLNLTEVLVRALLREKDPFHEAPIFRFTDLAYPVEEIISLFSAQPTLEVVLLTASGNNKTKIEGVVTQWDAARYLGSK